MNDISNIDNYYNTFDPTKGYTELLFRAGKVLQSKEVNELQSVLKQQIRNVGNTILTDGDKIEGCQLVIDGTKATVTRGKLYLNGNIRDIKDTVVTIKGQGAETIGALIEQEVVTPDDDPDLFDQASGFDNYNRDGAFRLKENIKIVVNDPKASVMFNLIDGEQVKVNTSEDLTQLDKVNLTLARRTFDESGNYKVNGLEITNRNKFDNNKVYISVEPGKAYVKGFEVLKLASTTLGLNRAEVTKSIANEPKVFSKTTSSYKVNNPYTTDLEISAIVEVTETVTRGSVVGGSDFLKKTPVVSLKNINQGGTTFTESVDYRLTEDSVDWSLNKRAPATGTQYTVTYTYNKKLVKDVEYVVEKNKNHETVIRFLGDGSNSIPRPVHESTFLVSYKFKLYRRDTISLDKDGRILVTEGQPNILRLVESPAVTDQEVLVLGSVLVNPIEIVGSGSDPTLDPLQIINNRTQAIPMLDLYKILDRLSSLEYNQAVTDLDKQAIEDESVSQLLGVFTDGFLGFTKADITHTKWDASIDLSDRSLTLPYSETAIALASKVDRETWSVEDDKKIRFSNKYQEVLEVHQPFRTGEIRVNSYNAFPKTPTVELSPNLDNWIDTSTIKVEGGTKVNTNSLRRWWYSKGSSWAMEEKARWQALGFADGGESIGSRNFSGNMVETDSVTKDVIDTAVTYMRTRTITVTISNLLPGADNIIVTFDGFNIPITPSQDVFRGTDPNTLKADVKGVTRCTFEIPKNTECGTKEVKVYPKNSPSLFGTANYTANGTKRTVKNTVFKQKVSVQPYDPIAQSFQFAEDKYLTALSMWFNDKDSSEPVVIQVRNTVNGYPGTIVYSETTVPGDRIPVGTEFKLDLKEPVYCNANEMYCFTVLSNSAVDSVHIAETNKLDLDSRVVVSKNPYLAGTLFSSSNALTWTAHQALDMRFKLFTAKFEPEQVIQFELDVNDVHPSRFTLASEEFIPAGCSIAWAYKESLEGSWIPLEKYIENEFENDELSKLYLKATLTGRPNIVPFIDRDSLQVVLAKNKLKASYISRNVEVPDPGYNNVKIVVDLELPHGTSVLVHFASDTDGNSWVSIPSTSTVQVSSRYKRYTFEKGSLGRLKQFRCKLELTTTTHNKVPSAKNLKCIMKTV